MPMSEVKSWQVYTNLQGLEELKQVARHDQKAALREAAKQFEALFLEMFLKQARKVNFDDEGLLSSERVSFYQAWYDKQLAQDIAAKGSMGLADQLVRQLSPQHPVVSVEEYEKMQQQKEQKPQQTLPTTAQMLNLRRR
ncbi:MAG TPA: flagellar biosynthesis [Sulfurivirga caldicuralii]|nr:flagellar biosynthesis [Sulfurivirga caldicuralii]